MTHPMAFEVELNERFILRHVMRDGGPVIKLRCPVCGRFADIDDDQFRGRVSVDCECGNFHETHNFAALESAALAERPELLPGTEAT